MRKHERNGMYQNQGRQKQWKMKKIMGSLSTQIFQPKFGLDFALKKEE